MASKKSKLPVHKGDIVFSTRKLGVLTRGRVTEVSYGFNDKKITEVWFHTGEPSGSAFGRPFEEYLGNWGKDLFFNLIDANMAARAKLERAIISAEKKLDALRATEGAPIEVISKLQERPRKAKD